MSAAGSVVSRGAGTSTQAAPYRCASPGRVVAVRAAALQTPPRWINGIDYLEVAPSQKQLRVVFVHALDQVPTPPLKRIQVEVRGGSRVRDPAVTGIAWQGHVLTVDLATEGDFSEYVLRLVAGPGSDAPPDGIDPALARITFRFKVDCPSDFDCRVEQTCAEVIEAPPPIDYLARDYPSLRRMVLDRLATLMPDWTERNPADLWVTLAEALAYRGDELSYYQDAVATEAYLGTARQRVSVRRHARLLDYTLHDGNNARVWVAFDAGAGGEGLTLQGCDPGTGLDGTLLLTAVPGLPPAIGVRAGAGSGSATSAGSAATEGALRTALAAGAEPFELVTPVTLFPAHNDLRFHTWSDDECCLPAGAIDATLRDDDAARVRLMPGDLLLLEARAGDTTGAPADADPHRRCVVRLTHVDPAATLVGGSRQPGPVRRDPVTGQAYVTVRWGEADALPFALCLSRRIDGVLVRDMSGACGNVGLADHGLSASRADRLVPGARLRRGQRSAPYRLPQTEVRPLTRQSRVRAARADGSAGPPVLIDPMGSAVSAMVWDAGDARPALDVRTEGARRSGAASSWTPQRDLLASGPMAREFVVETDTTGAAVLRFGDDVNGSAPADREGLLARVRTGNGARGNIGAGSLAHVAAQAGDVLGVRNPLPALGGVDPQPLEEAILYAPQAFRRQQRAVTARDYADRVTEAPGVQRAVATRRWTGSWYTMFITVDPRAGIAPGPAGTLDPAYEARLAAFVESWRLAGHDLEFDAPRYVSLDVALHVCTRPGYFVDDVERRLLQVFSADRLSDGRSGFFHADRYSFGEPVYLSTVIAAAMQVPGVAYVAPLRFQRLGRPAAGELDSGRIALGRLEIARLDNDPNAPEHGRMQFQVEAGGTS